MSVLEFVASLVDSLAWPAAILAAVVVVRKPLKESLAGPFNRVHVGPGGVDLEWNHQADKARESLGRVKVPASSDVSEPPRKLLSNELRDLAVESPAAAVAEAYSRVRSELRSVLAQAGEQNTENLDTHDLGQLALNKSLLDSQTLRSLEGLIVLHSLAHSPFTELSSNRANEYLALADGVIYAIRS